MANDLVERAARAAYESQPRNKPYDSLSKDNRKRIETAAAAAIAIVVEEAAKVAEGEVYYDCYRTWPFWEPLDDGSRPNRSRESTLVKHCDDIATAIRAMKGDAS